MARDVSIAVNVKNGFSSEVSNMKASSQAFRKDLEMMKRDLDDLDKKKVSLKVDAEITKNNLAQARKAFKDAENGVGDYEKALKRLSEAHGENERVANELREVSKAARQAEADIASLSDTSNKAGNKAGAGAGAGGGVMSTLGQAGATKMVGDLLGGLASTYVGSAYGREAGTYFDSALSSAAMGAAIGTAIAPGIGTAIGALGGAALGLVQGHQKVFQAKDDSFKEYYAGQYEDIMAGFQSSLMSGSGTAGRRERDRQKLETLIPGLTMPSYREFAGSGYEGGEAGMFQEWLVEGGRGLPFSYDELMQLSSGMLALGNSTVTVKDRIGALSEAGAALGMSGSEATSIAQLLESALELDKFDTRLIRTLTRTGINVKEAIAGSFQNELTGEILTEDDVLEVLDSLNVEDVVDAIYKYMGNKFEGAVAKAADSYEGLTRVLDSYKTDMDAAMGEGFNEERSRGMREQIDWLDGEGGGRMKEAYAMMGQWEASLVNEQEKKQRDMMTAVMEGVIPDDISINPDVVARLGEMAGEYAELSKSDTETAGAAMGALLAEAQGMAINEYHASEGYQLQLETQQDIINRLRENSALEESYYDFGYKMGEVFSLGLKASTKFELPEGMERPATYGGEASARLNAVNGAYGKPTAWGLDRVPYDNYPALLHEGERVQTASEARSEGQGQAPYVINVYDPVVREENDIDRIARSFVEQLTLHQAMKS